MESDIDIIWAARAAIDVFGGCAAEIMHSRGLAHHENHDAQGELYWNRVAAAVREIACGGTA